MKLELADLKLEAEELENSNPQRGALLKRGVVKVQEGLGILAQLGYAFQAVQISASPPSEPSPSGVEHSDAPVPILAQPAGGAHVEESGGKSPAPVVQEPAPLNTQYPLSEEVGDIVAAEPVTVAPPTGPAESAPFASSETPPLNS